MHKIWNTCKYEKWSGTAQLQSWGDFWGNFWGNWAITTGVGWTDIADTDGAPKVGGSPESNSWQSKMWAFAVLPVLQVKKQMQKFSDLFKLTQVGSDRQGTKASAVGTHLLHLHSSTQGTHSPLSVRTPLLLTCVRNLESDFRDWFPIAAMMNSHKYGGLTQQTYSYSWEVWYSLVQVQEIWSSFSLD